MDIIVTPLVTIASGYVVSTLIGPGIDFGMKSFGSLIMWGTEQRPILMGIIVAVLMGLALTAPISSAAIALMLDLHGVAAGAATIGCAAQMVGFAVSSYRENKMGGLIAIGIGTSMLQVPNIIRNPRILIPPTIAGAILAPFGTTIWLMENNAAGAGMGTSGLVGQIMTFTTMGFGPDVWMKVIILHIIGPALISLILSEYMRKKAGSNMETYISAQGRKEMKKLESIEQFNEMRSSGKHIFMFSADWCPDCRVIEPVLPEIEAKYRDYNFVYVDRDQFIDLCIELDVFGIPSFIGFRDGQELGRFVSKDRKTQEEIENFIQTLEN